ncbi:MAG: N-formylglutamate deformylase [Woeseiaceae bacterium]|nr:N-formylglutamate deformylase [Woeseiaceae bacterium]
MMDVYTFHPGILPLLLSVPHDGVQVPAEIKGRMTPEGQALPDTDWHVAELYDFARDLGASMLVANYSRYVVDLNRPASDADLYPGQLATGLCPLQTFAGKAIYTDGEVGVDEKAARLDRYWQPYHARIQSELTAMRERHGYALLWDAHSIPSLVPRLFADVLPELNLGTNDGKSSQPSLEAAVVGVVKAAGYSSAVNGRFKGGYITRHYGQPADGVHAMQLEIAQRAYMNEDTGAFDATKAARLRVTLRALLQAFVDAAEA